MNVVGDAQKNIDDYRRRKERARREECIILEFNASVALNVKSDM